MLLSYDMQIVYIAYLIKILRKGKKKTNGAGHEP